jgi:hypothetical protein
MEWVLLPGSSGSSEKHLQVSESLYHEKKKRWRMKGESCIMFTKIKEADNL